MGSIPAQGTVYLVVKVLGPPKNQVGLSLQKLSVHGWELLISWVLRRSSNYPKHNKENQKKPADGVELIIRLLIWLFGHLAFLPAPHSAAKRDIHSSHLDPISSLREFRDQSFVRSFAVSIQESQMPLVLKSIPFSFAGV